MNFNLIAKSQVWEKLSVCSRTPLRRGVSITTDVSIVFGTSDSSSQQAGWIIPMSVIFWGTDNSRRRRDLTRLSFTPEQPEAIAALIRQTILAEQARIEEKHLIPPHPGVVTCTTFTVSNARGGHADIPLAEGFHCFEEVQGYAEKKAKVNHLPIRFVPWTENPDFNSGGEQDLIQERKKKPVDELLIIEERTRDGQRVFE